MFGKKSRVIAEQEERIRVLEQQLEAMTSDNKRLKERVVDIERRERGIGRALNEATATVDNMITDAQRKAAVLLEQAQGECDALRKKAERVVDDAYRSAREIVQEAENEGAQKRAEIQQQIDQYASLLTNYDTMVQEQLASAQEGAKRYAELSRALHESVPQLLGTDGTPLPGLGKPEDEQGDAPADTSVILENDMPDYQANPLRFTPSHENGGDEQLWTVDKIAKDDPSDKDTDVDAIIDEILAATEDDG